MEEITERVGDEPVLFRTLLRPLLRPCPLLTAINAMLSEASESNASEWASSSYTSDEY
jgi:hypothetical protein